MKENKDQENLSPEETKDAVIRMVAKYFGCPEEEARELIERREVEEQVKLAEKWVAHGWDVDTNGNFINHIVPIPEYVSPETVMPI